MESKNVSHRRPVRGEGEESAWVHGCFLAVVCVSVFFVGAGWADFHGVLLALVGTLVCFFPPVASLPRLWWGLGGLFLILACGQFLPATWFGIPKWREEMELLGVETGSVMVIQWRQALEMLALFAIILLVGLWLAGHRASSRTLRRCALVFCVAVALYAVMSHVFRDLVLPGGAKRFGFFPNRNHTATYLAMGGICGLGCVLQFGRDRNFILMGFALVATVVSFWGIAVWSVSRAGIALVCIGVLAWLPLLGRRYLGRHGIWGVCLILLGAAGFFLISDTEVKQRIGKSLEVAGGSISPEAGAPVEKSGLETIQEFDFRVPVFLDAADMITAQPLTGIGAGQFHAVYPQYRKRTIMAQDSDVYHPESDWLWMASETGLPATCVLLALVVVAVRRSAKDILSGRDRALRSACLVAALLVPLHGVFDVPGHRISLAWSAALLFSLSLHALPARPPSPWPFRLMGCAIMAAAVLLLGLRWLGGRQPATAAATEAVEKAMALYREDQELQKAATAQGRIYQPAPSEDRLEKALMLLDAAKPLSPLDRTIPRHEAFLALHFDDKIARIDRAFALDRSLDPTWVVGPLRQALAWTPVDKAKATDALDEALRRAAEVEKLDPGNRWSPKKCKEWLEHSTR